MKIVTTGLIIALLASVCTAQTPKTHEVVAAKTKDNARISRLKTNYGRVEIGAC